MIKGEMIKIQGQKEIVAETNECDIKEVQERDKDIEDKKRYHLIKEG